MELNLSMLKPLLLKIFNSCAASLGPHRWPIFGHKHWILMYHRILPQEIAAAEWEEPGMYVTPETFESHLVWLREFLQPVKLQDWVSGSDSFFSGHTVSITFDDGWRDNYQYAFPILKKLQIPATIFLVSHMIDTDKVFWPNRLAALLNKLQKIEDWPASCDWLKEILADKNFNFKNSEDFSELIQACKKYSDEEIWNRLNAMQNDLELLLNERIMLNWQEIDEMKGSGLIDFGSHTCHHVRLNENVTEEIMAAEIRESKTCLDNRLEQETSLFCFPNGDRCDTSDELVRQYYQAAVTTRKGTNSRGHSFFELKRIGLHEDISATRTEFLSRISGLR